MYESGRTGYDLEPYRCMYVQCNVMNGSWGTWRAYRTHSRTLSAAKDGVPVVHEISHLF